MIGEALNEEDGRKVLGEEKVFGEGKMLWRGVAKI